MPLATVAICLVTQWKHSAPSFCRLAFWIPSRSCRINHTVRVFVINLMVIIPVVDLPARRVPRQLLPARPKPLGAWICTAPEQNQTSNALEAFILVTSTTNLWLIAAPWLPFNYLHTNTQLVGIWYLAIITKSWQTCRVDPQMVIHTP